MIRRIAVVVPAADEQDRITACLDAIERARRHVRVHVPTVERVDVFAVLDACRDQTPAVVARFGTRVQALTSTARCVGVARAHGAGQALAAAGTGATAGAGAELWLANTDADSEVPHDWLTEMVTAADEGAHLVLGTVLPDSDLPRALRATWLAEHQLVDGHPHVHGANFGIRADTYLELGGWSAVRSDEDVDLAARAVAHGGLTIARSAAIPVITSARMAGRAPNGFSSYLRHLHDRGSVALEFRAG